MGLSIEKHGYTGWVMPVTPVPAYTSRDSTTKHGRRHVRGHPNLVCPILTHDFFSKTTHAVQERDPCPKKDKAAMSLKQRYMYHIYKAIAKNPKLTPWLISIIRVIKVHFFNSEEMQMYFHTLCPFTFEGFAVCTGLTGNLLKTPTPCRPLHYQTWLTAGMLNLIHIYPVFLATSTMSLPFIYPSPPSQPCPPVWHWRDWDKALCARWGVLSGTKNHKARAAACHTYIMHIWNCCNRWTLSYNTKLGWATQRKKETPHYTNEPASARENLARG